MKYSTRSSAFALSLFLLSVGMISSPTKLHALINPQLKVTFVVAAHPDPYISAWADKKGTMVVTIINSSAKPVDIVLDAQLSNDGGEIAYTQQTKMRKISVPPGASQYYAEDVFPASAIGYRGSADQITMRTGMLPAGAYSICVRALDSKTYVELTTAVCKNFDLTNYAAPKLLLPEDGSMLPKASRPMLRWTPVTPKYPGTVHYRLQLFEVLNGQSPADAFRVNRPILDYPDIAVTQLLYPPDYELPQAGKQYVWGVRATDDNGNTIGEPGGLGGPFSFVAYGGPRTGDTVSISGMGTGGTPADSLWHVMVIPADSLRKIIAQIAGKDTIIRKDLGLGADSSKPVLSIDVPSRVQPATNGLRSSISIQPSVANVCCGSDLLISWFTIMPPYGNTSYTYTLTAPFGTIGPISYTGGIWWINYHSFTITAANLPSPGSYACTLTITRGTGSTVSSPLTINVYPAIVTPATMTVNTIQANSLCYNCEGELDITVCPTGAPVHWSFFDNPPTPPLPTPATGTPWPPNGGSGISIWTNPITPSSCTYPQGFVTRTYRAELDLASYNLPPYPPNNPPSGCPSTWDVPVTVYCPTVAGTINATCTDGHVIEAGNKICSWNHTGPVAANYPIVLNINLTGQCGNIVSWTGSPLTPGGTGTAQTLTINAPATLGTNTYTITATVQNGPAGSSSCPNCSTQQVQVTFTVVDPPPQPQIGVTKICGMPPTNSTCPFDVCPHCDAVLAISNASSMPVGTIYQWSYYPITGCPYTGNCPPVTATGWNPVSTSPAGIGTTQNTNEIGPLNSSWTHVWWKVTAQDPGGVCDPATSECCLINVIQPPCAPLVKGPHQKCPGEAVKLIASMPSDPCCGPVTCYQWYWYGDGSPVGPCSTTIQPCSATKPGSYVLVAQGPCESTESKPFVVENIKTSVAIEGCECCPKLGEKITLKAMGSSDCATGGTGTYSWSGPGITGNSSTTVVVSPPVGTTSYCVTYTDPCGCTATECCIMTVCN